MTLPNHRHLKCGYIDITKLFPCILFKFVQLLAFWIYYLPWPAKHFPKSVCQSAKKHSYFNILTKYCHCDEGLKIVVFSWPKKQEYPESFCLRKNSFFSASVNIILFNILSFYFGQIRLMKSNLDDYLAIIMLWNTKNNHFKCVICIVVCSCKMSSLDRYSFVLF